MEYLNILIVFAIAPSIIFLFFSRKSIAWRAFILGGSFVATLGIVADYIGLYRNLWFFSKEESKMLGIWLWGVPLEDFIFVIILPILVISVYEFTKKYVVNNS